MDIQKERKNEKRTKEKIEASKKGRREREIAYGRLRSMGRQFYTLAFL